MPRTPTETDTTIEWEERLTDPDSTSLSLSLALDAVDDGTGFTSDGRDSSNISWLSFSKTENNYNGQKGVEALMDIVAQKSGLKQNHTYRFKITADDGTTSVSHTVVLSIEEPVIYDGSYAYTAGADTIEVHSLGTNWDLGTASEEAETSFIDQDTGGYTGIAFKPSGSRCYLLDVETGAILEYELSTPWDTFTATRIFSFDITSKGTSPKGMAADVNGKYLYVMYEDSGIGGVVYQIEMSTPWDLSTASFLQNADTGFSGATAPYITPTGDRLYVCDGTRIRWFNLTTLFDITSISAEVGNDIYNVNGVHSLFFKPDGKKLFTVEGQPKEISAYDLGTAWDPNTEQSTNQYSVDQAHLYFGQ